MQSTAIGSYPLEFLLYFTSPSQILTCYYHLGEMPFGRFESVPFFRIRRLETYSEEIRSMREERDTDSKNERDLVRLKLLGPWLLN